MLVLAVPTVALSSQLDQRVVYAVGQDGKVSVVPVEVGDSHGDMTAVLSGLGADAGDTSEGRTAADNATVRTVFVVGPDKQIKLALAYPMTTGRNFDEILRAVDALQTTDKAAVSTPVDWKQGDRVIVPPTVSTADAKEKYDDVEEHFPYLRTTTGPKQG